MFKDEQPLLIKTIDNMIYKARVPQAFIFYGESGTSKKEVAKYFIKELYKKTLNLDEESNVIKRIEDESHTNVFYIKKDKDTTISKDLIKDTIDTQNRTSLEEGPRFYVLEDAAYLNKSSMNELLKFVEEPSDNVYIIFMLDNLSLLQDTIVSRCSLFHFLPINEESIKERFIEYSNQSFLNYLVRLYQNENKIKEQIENENVIKMFEMVSDMFRETYERNGSIILYFNEHAEFVKEEPILFVSFMSYYIEDILNKKIGIDILNKDEENRIEDLSKLYSLEDLSSFTESMLETKRLIETKKPINLELYILNLLIKLEMKGRKNG